MQPAGDRFPIPRMPPLLPGDALQNTVVIAIEEAAAGSRKVTGEILGKFHCRRLDHLRPPTPALSHHTRTHPTTSLQLTAKIVDHPLNHGCLLVSQPRTVMAAGRLASTQITHLQRHHKSLVIQLGLTGLAGQIGDRFRKPEDTAALHHPRHSLAGG